jgi:hypothetical protein
MMKLDHVPILSHRIFMEELENIARDLLAHQSTTSELLNLSSDIKSTVGLHQDNSSPRNII